MTQPVASGTRAPIGAYHPTGEDRTTYRRWARGYTIAYSVLIVALLAVSLWFRDQHDSRMTKESRTIGAGAMATPPAAPLTGKSQKRNYF